MKFIKSLILTIILGLCLQSTALANTKGVAKAIILKGNVQAYNPKTKEKITLKRGSWVQEGYLVKTAKKSFVKFLFIDKSQMNLGPKSQMAINKFPRKKAGIITLLKGSLRAKVTKNYLDMKDKNKSKLFIKTKTAAMGVRGTDFVVTYNPINRNTALITFSGAVAMAQLKATVKNFKTNQRVLERIVSSDKAVIVRKGQFSGVNPGKTLRATTPVKINPGQLETMKGHDASKSADDQTSSKKKGSKKKYRNIIPPGANSKDFANDANVESQVQKVIGATATKIISDKFAKGPKEIGGPPPEGYVNKATGEIAPPAGGYVDLHTALYIAPPPGSTFDAATETFIPPADMGGFNAATGNYQHDTHVLQPDGSFDKIPNRSPASTGDGPEVKPPELAPIDEPLPEGAAPLNPSSGGPDGEPTLQPIPIPRPPLPEPLPPKINKNTKVKFNIN
ncbi:hypothetical protein A9Q84_11610 [Halobacteriovorax marinus]|uniref:FecR protein domain-containing protein n=1 Tax=Halobacteriovorax marinus TaxID=97084 RepID=A0A1Y5F893_9BACT|nr:hypothetical protein A9Q84_11610 [Halobacteriovorax marinus]